MRRLLVLSVLLLGAAWVAAQTSSSSSASSPTQSSTSPSQSSTSSTPSSSSSSLSGMGQSASSSSAGETKVEGCLSGSNGSYTLASKGGTTYQLSGDTSKLTEHVGHEVQITGRTQSASSSSPSSSSGTGAASSGQTGAGSQPTLSVSSVKHISSSCSSSGTSH